MIAKFPGKCSYCGKPTKAGVDIYDVETRKNWHQACHDRRPVELFAANEAEQLARELGFIGPGEPIPAKWFGLPVLPAGDRDVAARTEPATLFESDPAG